MKEQTLANAKAAEKVEEKKIELKPYQIESELKKMYPKMSAGQIAKKYGVSRGVILNKLKKFKIKITTRTSPVTGPKHFKKEIDRSFHEKAFLKKKLESGLSVYKISVLTKATYGQVMYFIKKYDLLSLVQEQRLIRARAEREKIEKQKKKPQTTKAKKK